MTIYTLPQLRDGTGFRRGTRFIEIGPPGDPILNGSVYTALRDEPDDTVSKHVGVFSDEELARAACQEDADDDWEASRRDQPDVPRPVITWGRDDQSHPMLDGTVYTVIMTTLDVRTGMG
jgi:hypothetical protein